MSTRDRRVIPATCQLHGGSAGFTNLVITRRPSGEVVLDPHAIQTCVICLDPDSARLLHQILGEWLAR